VSDIEDVYRGRRAVGKEAACTVYERGIPAGLATRLERILQNIELHMSDTYPEHPKLCTATGQPVRARFGPGCGPSRPARDADLGCRPVSCTPVLISHLGQSAGSLLRRRRHGLAEIPSAEVTSRRSRRHRRSRRPTTRPPTPQRWPGHLPRRHQLRFQRARSRRARQATTLRQCTFSPWGAEAHGAAANEQSRVADAASDLLVDVLGENGRHARTAIGVAGLPRNSPLEIQMVCTAV
jgi:hypothetical protein